MSNKDFRFGISSSAAGVDLNQLLITHAASTYFMRIANDMPELGLQTNDIILVDRALTPKHSDLVVVGIANDSDLKIMRFQELLEEFELWGVVEHVIRKLRP